jgi:hypothetical protein
VRLELAFSQKQYDIACFGRFREWLYLQNVSVLDRGIHAPAAGTKAESLPARDQFARQHCEKGGLLPRFSHES